MQPRFPVSGLSLGTFSISSALVSRNPAVKSPVNPGGPAASFPTGQGEVMCRCQLKGLHEGMNERNPRAPFVESMHYAIVVVRSTYLRNCTRQPRIIPVHHTKQWLPHRDCSCRCPSVPWRGLWVEDLLLRRAFQHLACHSRLVLQKGLKCLENGRHRGDTAINSVNCIFFSPSNKRLTILVSRLRSSLVAQSAWPQSPEAHS